MLGRHRCCPHLFALKMNFTCHGNEMKFLKTAASADFVVVAIAVCCKICFQWQSPFPFRYLYIALVLFWFWFLFSSCSPTNLNLKSRPVITLQNNDVESDVEFREQLQPAPASRCNRRCFFFFIQQSRVVDCLCRLLQKGKGTCSRCTKLN